MTGPSLRTIALAPWKASLALPTPVAADDAEAPACPGCGRPVPEAFCAGCGESRPTADLSLGALIAGGIENLTSLDVKLLRTLRLLLTRPGQLTVEYRRGVRSGYTRPFQLFLMAIAAFFLAMASLARAPMTMKDFEPGRVLGALRPDVERAIRQSHETPEQFLARVDARANDVKRVLVALFVPTFALFLALMYVGSGRYALEHLVFATHYLTFMLLLSGGWKAATRLLAYLVDAHYTVGGHLARPDWVEPVQIAGSLIIALGLASVYLCAALRRAYGDKRGDAVARTGMLVVVVVGGMTAYNYLLYSLTLRLL